MEKQNKYDILFSELKTEIIYNQHKKRQTLDHLKTTLPFNHSKLKKKKQYTPFIISLTSIVVATCLVILLLNDQPSILIGTSNVGNQHNETSNPELIENPPLTENHTIFDVENFGEVHFQLTNDILTLLSNFYLDLAGVEGSEFLDTVKIDGNGVVIINFNNLFIEAYTRIMGTKDTGELMHALNRYVFSYNDVETAYYLLDGDASAWNEWLRIVDEPITRESYKKYISNLPTFEDIFRIQDEKYHLYGITVNESKESIIETLGTDYIEEKDIVVGGAGNYDRLVYEKLELTLLFLQNNLVTAYINIRDTQSFDNYFESFTGNKLSRVLNEKQTSMENYRIFYSEKGLQVAVASYNPYGTLSLSLNSTTSEAISNLSKGIY